MKQYETKAKELLAQLTLEEKAGLCSGSDFWHTKGVERLGVNKVMVTDGPHGLRKQEGSSDHLGINQSVPSTCFPTAATTACSFDADLLRQMGEALAEECLQEDVAVLLGPGVNIKRSPLCGRNFEYFSEDPFLSGVLASALIEGVQSRGVGTSLKHYAANNQETRRMVINSVVDDRALREIYLTAFEMAVKQQQPWTVMCSYNQINGEYGSQHNRLLNQILREEWGFEGLVVTDWGAIVDRVQGLSSGLDLEMPYAGPGNDAAIVQAVQNGSLPLQTLDTAALRVLCMLVAAADGARKGYWYNADAHHRLACRIAAESCVLLKNENNLLPLGPNTKLAVLGAFAEAPRYQGAGSSRINPLRLPSLVGVLQERGTAFTYAPGYSLESDQEDPELLAVALDAAQNAEVAVVCIGLPDSYESEGFDREHLNLPQSHISLLQQVAAKNPRTVVLLFGGSPVAMPWLGSANSLLMLYLGGEAGAEAAADVLFGVVNPSGKLAETFPLQLEDTPCYAYFPGGDKTVEYRESIFVGYRYYDKAGKQVLFPFGYGLSYTSFAYSNLQLQESSGTVTASVCITNTGSRAGAEAVQFYVGQTNPSVMKPLRELQAFGKVYLQPGQQTTLTVTLPPRAFSYYNVQSGAFVVETGEYTVYAAASSRDIRCEETILMQGVPPQNAPVPQEYAALGSSPLSISTAAFQQLYGAPLPQAQRQKDEPFTINSTLKEIAATQTGGALLQQITQQFSASFGTAKDDTGFSNMLLRSLDGLPLRALLMFSNGAMDKAQLDGLVAAMNAEVSASNPS